MRTRTTPARTTTLSRVGREFEYWRRTRPRRAPIPAALWALAVEHARAVGVHATARRLRLDYYALKQRVEAAGGAGAPGASPPPAFVEVVPASPMPAAVSECVIDLADARGTMRIALKSAALPDLAALSQSFWRSRA